MERARYLHLSALAQCAKNPDAGAPANASQKRHHRSAPEPWRRSSLPFLDEMTSCKAEDAIPKDVLPRAGEGSIDAEGNCAFASIRVSYHYHSESEFVSSTTEEEPPSQGELTRRGQSPLRAGQKFVRS